MPPSKPMGQASGSTAPAFASRPPGDVNESDTGAPEDFDLGELLYRAARIAGMPDAEADQFAADGVAQSGPVMLAVQTLLPDDAGPIVLTAAVDRPAELSEEQWFAILLQLNVSSFVLMPGAFGIDTDGRAVLAMQMNENYLLPPMFAAAMKGAVTICMNLLVEQKLTMPQPGVAGKEGGQ